MENSINKEKVENEEKEKVEKILNHVKLILKRQVNENGQLDNANNNNVTLQSKNQHQVSDNGVSISSGVADLYNKLSKPMSLRLLDVADAHRNIIENANDKTRKSSSPSPADPVDSSMAQHTILKDRDLISKSNILTKSSDSESMNINTVSANIHAERTSYESDNVGTTIADSENNNVIVSMDAPSNAKNENRTVELSTQSPLTVGGVSLGVNELSLIVEEYEKLKERCLKLERTAEHHSTHNAGQQSQEDASRFLEKIQDLQLENQRLTDEIASLNKRNEEGGKMNSALQSTIERLETVVGKQRGETAAAGERLAAHDAAAKRAITVLQKEMGARIEQVTKMYEDSVSEKDEYIVKISKLEASIDDLKQTHLNQRRKLSEQEMEIDRLKNLLKVREEDNSKVYAANEQFESDISKLMKRIDSHKDEMEGQEIKVKWAQNKLKTELDAHKETRKQVSTLTTKLQVAKEEGEQIRRDCQEMVERYQDFQDKTVELNQIKDETQKLKQQLFDQKTEVVVLEGKNTNLTNVLLERDKDCAEMKTAIDYLKEQVKEMQEAKVKIKNYEEEINNLQKNKVELTQQLNECAMNMKEHEEKQNEFLLYSQSLTENNAVSKATLTELHSKLDSMKIEKENLIKSFKKREQDLLSQVDYHTNERKILQSNVDDLIRQINQKSITVNELSGELEEARNELNIMKKKNASQLKDLQRELHQTTRKIEQLEANSNGSIESLSNRSRTSSCNSLEKLHTNHSPSSASPDRAASPQITEKGVVVIPQDHYVTQPNRPANRNNGCQELEIDKKVLVERICKLQKLHAKKNEKIEFQEDHIMQLTEALQKKTRIIQNYFARHDSGSVAPDKFDQIKADVSQHGGIMASVYSAKSHDKAMTLELSLAINNKLQAVCEDMVLKNMMLQENLNTLGVEIAKYQERVKPS